MFQLRGDQKENIPRYQDEHKARDEQNDFSNPEKEAVRRGCCMLPRWFIVEFTELFSLAWYLSVINLFSNVMGTLSVTFCGHLGTVELDGVSLACSLLNVFGICIANGLCTACDTLFSQSFGGSNKKKVGIYLQQSLIIIPLFVLPCWAIHLNVETLLVMMGNTPEVAAISGRYLLLLMPGTLAVFLLRVLTTYLRSQNVLWPTLVSGLIGTVTNVVGHVVALFVWETGIEGSAVVQSMSFIAMLAFTFGYIIVSKMYEDTWSGWSVEAFHDWGRFLYIGVAGMLMLFASVFGQETGTFFAGALGETELGAQSILFNTQVVTFTIPFGFGIACNIRIGQLLGSRDAKKARRSTMIGLGMAAVTTSVIGLVGILLRHLLPLLFTNDSDVIALTADVYPVMFFNYVFDGITVCFLGILRGCNKETVATIITFIGYYIIGIPLCVLLMFTTGIGIKGFWWGLAVGMIINTVLFSVALYKVDYEREVNKVLQRAGLDPEANVDASSPDTKKWRPIKFAHLESDDDDAEAAALLSYKTIARHKTEKRLQRFQQVMSGNNPHHSRNDLYIPLHPPKPTESNSSTYVILTRSLFITSMVLVLIVGLVCRSFFGVNSSLPTSTPVAA